MRLCERRCDAAKRSDVRHGLAAQMPLRANSLLTHAEPQF